LTDVELLALFLRTGVPGRSAIDLARDMLHGFGSLRALLDASAAELRSLPGIGPAKLAELQAIREIVQRSLNEELHVNATTLDSPSAVRDYLRLLIGARPYEVFVTMYLDVRHRLIHTEESSRGTLTRTAVYPREITREALRHNAAALIIAHNHPSGVATPSAADQQLTRHIKQALELVDIQLLDHFVVASSHIFSFAEQGRL
jgi:DNA repair protein RadC